MNKREITKRIKAVKREMRTAAGTRYIELESELETLTYLLEIH